MIRKVLGDGTVIFTMSDTEYEHLDEALLAEECIDHLGELLISYFKKIAKDKRKAWNYIREELLKVVLPEDNFDPEKCGMNFNHHYRRITLTRKD